MSGLRRYAAKRYQRQRISRNIAGASFRQKFFAGGRCVGENGEIIVRMPIPSEQLIIRWQIVIRITRAADDKKEQQQSTITNR